MATRVKKALNPHDVYRKPLRLRLKENRQMYVFLLVPLIWLFIFKYYPMYGVQISFREYDIKRGIVGSTWVGFANFIRFFRSYELERTLGNTLFLSIVGTCVSFPIPIFFALLLNSVRSRKWKGVVENITYMPHFISTVVLVGMMKRIFDINTGMVHNVLGYFGIRYHTDLFAGASHFR